MERGGATRTTFRLRSLAAVAAPENWLFLRRVQRALCRFCVSPHTRRVQLILGCEVQECPLCGCLLEEEAQYNGKETSQSFSKFLFFMSTDKSMIPISDFCHYNAMRESPNVVGKKNVT